MKDTVKALSVYHLMSALSIRPAAPPPATSSYSPLASLPIELAVEDLLAGAEVQPAFGDGNDLAPHDLPLDVRIGIVFAGIVVSVLARRLMWRDLFQPAIVVLVKA